MKISVQTGNVIDTFGIEEGFKMIHEAGFEAVDINLDHCLRGSEIRSGETSGFFDQSDEAILAACRPYKEAADKYGITFTQAHAPFPNRVPDAAMNDYVLKAVQKTIMMCNYFGCGNLVVHEGSLSFADRTADEWDYNINMYTQLIPYLKLYNVVCCLENLFCTYRGKVMQGPCANPIEACRYIDTLNEIAGERCFGFCLDVGHAMLVGQDVYSFIHALGDRLQCLHIHDNNGQTDQHMLPYMGLTDWDRFCRALKEIGYNHDLSFETFAATSSFDKELCPHVLRLAAATASLFRTRITG